MGEASRHNSDPFNEKYCAYGEPTSPARTYIPSGRGQDPEKAERHYTDPSIYSESPCSDRISAVRVWENMPSSQHEGEGLAKILVHLSLSNPLVSFLFTIYAILVSLLVLLFGWIRAIGKDGLSLKDQLIKALAPALRYELRLINTDVNLFSRGDLSPAHLFGVLMLSPLFALGVMLAAWTAATFWMYTTILGEPNQKQGKEIDGKSAARWVKRLWERWLLLGL